MLADKLIPQLVTQNLFELVQLIYLKTKIAL